MSDLSTSYLGMNLRNPVIVGSSTHTISADKAKRLEDAGAGALVLKSIFEEQIRADVSDMYDALESDAMHPEAYEYIQADLPMDLGPEKYLERLRTIKDAVEIPVIASVNCTTAKGWQDFSRKIEAVGADAIEVNIYDIPTDVTESGEAIEARHIETVRTICAESSLPIAAKIGPFYSSAVNFIPKLERAGAAGVVMFNRFFQPDIDIETLSLINQVNLSRAEDIRLPLRWIAILRNIVKCDLALTTGVHNAEGAIKALLAGANAVQICSVLYKRDVSVMGEIVKGLSDWMDRKEFASISDFCGKLSERDLTDKRGFERAQYVKALVGLE